MIFECNDFFALLYSLQEVGKYKYTLTWIVQKVTDQPKYFKKSSWNFL